MTDFSLCISPLVVLVSQTPRTLVWPVVLNYYWYPFVRLSSPRLGFHRGKSLHGFHYPPGAVGVSHVRSPCTLE